MSDEWEKLKFPSQPVTASRPDWHRILSGVLTLGWLSLCTLAGGLGVLLVNTVQLLVPLACIWFPEELGSLTTSLPSLFSNMPITRSSPGWLLRLFGWIALLCLTIVRLIIVAVLRP
jgi:hypothetical protein